MGNAKYTSRFIGTLAVSLSLGIATPAWADTAFGSTYAVNPTGILCTRDEAGGNTGWTCLVPDANGGFAIVSGLPSTATGEPDHAAADAHADANTGVDAVLFGNVESSAQGSRAVAVGAGAQATGQQATAVGNEAIASQNSAVAVGGTSSALGSLRSTEASGMGSTAIGAGSVAANTGAVAIGDSATASGAYSSALGTGARATDHAGLAFGNNAWAREFDTAIGSGALQNSMESGNAVAIGANAGASAANATESVLIGSNAGVTINGSRNVGTGHATLTAADGSLNTASGNYALAMVTGSNNLGMGTGAGAVVTGDNNVSIGNLAGTLATVDADGNPAGATPASFSNAVNIGNRASGLTDGAVAIGSEATVSVRNSVALGSGSVADGATLGDEAYSPTGDLADISGIAPVGEVSLGSAGNERRITNVAAGSADTDAVNVSQLRALAEIAVNGSQIVALGDSIAATLSNTSSYDPATNSVSTQIVVGGTVHATVEAAIQAVNASVNGGWSVTTGSTGSGVATSSSVAQVVPGTTAQFTAGNNVVITQNGTEVQVAVNPSLSGIESMSIVDGPTIDRTGIDMAGQQIANLGAGVALTDAVNLGQLTGGMANTLSSAMSHTDQQIAGMRLDLADLRRDANGSTAAAMALAQVPQAFEPGMGIVGFGVSHWQGEQAIAVGASKASDNGRVVIRASGTYNTRGRAGAAVGAGIQF